MNDVRLITAEGDQIDAKEAEHASGLASNKTQVQGVYQIVSTLLSGYSVTVGRIGRRRLVTFVGCNIPQPKIKPRGEQA